MGAAMEEHPPTGMIGSRKLTARQGQMLQYIRDRVRNDGYPPTMREIGAHMSIRSTNGVKDHLRALERKGYIKVMFQTARGIRLLGAITPMVEDKHLIEAASIIDDGNRCLMEKLIAEALWVRDQS